MKTPQLPERTVYYCVQTTNPRALHSFPTRRSSDLRRRARRRRPRSFRRRRPARSRGSRRWPPTAERSEEHTSELQSRLQLVCRLLLEKKKHPPFDPAWGKLLHCCLRGNIHEIQAKT